MRQIYGAKIAIKSHQLIGQVKKLFNVDIDVESRLLRACRPRSASMTTFYQYNNYYKIIFKIITIGLFMRLPVPCNCARKSYTTS